MTHANVAEQPTTEDNRATLIGQQNDQFRSTWGADFTIPGSIVQTQGVNALSVAWHVGIMTNIMRFDSFEEGDTHHCFGSFDLTVGEETRSFFWAITLYDNECQDGSPVPEDPKQTHRVLTIMFPSEY